MTVGCFLNFIIFVGPPPNLHCFLYYSMRLRKRIVYAVGNKLFIDILNILYSVFLNRKTICYVGMKIICAICISNNDHTK